jgi:hypothetical protein
VNLIMPHILLLLLLGFERYAVISEQSWCFFHLLDMDLDSISILYAFGGTFMYPQ